MIKNKLPVRFTGQHFTIDKVLIADAIKIAKINLSSTYKCNFLGADNKQ